MDDNMVKDNLENNSKRSSLAESVIVKWKWDDNRKHRIFEGLRIGGTAETQYDLDLKYPEESVDHESVLVHADQIKDFSEGEKKNKILELLNSEAWVWDTNKSESFNEEINKLF